MTNGKLNGHEREKLAMEVQAEALRPTPQVNGPSLQEKLSTAWQRIERLKEQVATLQREKRENRAQFQREAARQRRELMEDEQKRARRANL